MALTSICRAVCSTAARHTCPQAHCHRAVLLSSAPDAQLAVVVTPPAPEAAAARHSAHMKIYRGDGGDGDACKGEWGALSTGPGW